MAYNKATIKEVMRIHLTSSPHTMSALGVIKTGILGKYLPFSSTAQRSPSVCTLRNTPSRGRGRVTEVPAKQHRTQRQPDNREGGFKLAKVVER